MHMLNLIWNASIWFSYDPYKRVINLSGSALTIVGIKVAVSSFIGHVNIECVLRDFLNLLF